MALGIVCFPLASPFLLSSSPLPTPLLIPSSSETTGEGGREGGREGERFSILNLKSPEVSTSFHLLVCLQCAIEKSRHHKETNTYQEDYKKDHYLPTRGPETTTKPQRHHYLPTRGTETTKRLDWTRDWMAGSVSTKQLVSGMRYLAATRTSGLCGAAASFSTL